MTNEEKIDLDVRNVIANAHFEGFDLTDEEIKIGYKIRRGEITADEAISYYLKKSGIRRNG